MKNYLSKYRYIFLRRTLQGFILLLFFMGNYAGWKVLTGNYSSAKIFDVLTLADPFAVIQILFSGFVATASLIIGALIIILIYAVLGGRIFCSWICPLNIVTDLAAYVRRKLKISDSSNISISKNTRYYILGLSIIVTIISGVAAFEIVNPISILYRGIIFGFGLSWVIILGIFIFDLGVLKNGWCGYLCPLGTFYSIIGKFGLIKVYHKKESCTSCNLCYEYCHESQVLDIINIKSGYIKSDQCTKCGRCIEVCEDNALFFSRNYKK